MADFKKTIATAEAKIAKAEIEAFKARLEAILDAILQDASPNDAARRCARVPSRMSRRTVREAHQDEFKAEFLRSTGRLHRHPARAGIGRG